VLAAVGSAALTVLAVAGNPTLSPDSDLYLYVAARMAREGFLGAQGIHQWPFYPGVIAAVLLWSPLSIVGAAHLVDILLLSLTSAAFVWLVQLGGGSRTTQLMAAVVILCHPGINRYRGLVLRDFGLWAFGLLSLVLLARFAERPSWKTAVGWTFSIWVAVAFRPEAVALLVGGPVTLLLGSAGPWRTRASRGIALLATSLVALATSALALIAFPGPRAVAVHFGRSLGVWLTMDFDNNVLRAANAAAAQFPLGYGREYAPFMIAAGLVAVLIAKVVKAMGIFYAALVLWMLPSPQLEATPTRLVRFSAYVSVAGLALICYLYMLWLLYLEIRYAVLISVILALFCPFALERLHRLAGPRRTLAWLAVVAGLLLGLRPVLMRLVAAWGS
jgi:hypothetical protein